MDKSEEYYIKVSKALEIQNFRPYYSIGETHRIAKMGDWFTNKKYAGTKYEYKIECGDGIVEIDNVWLPTQSQLCEIFIHKWWNFYHRHLHESPYSNYPSAEIAGLHLIMEMIFYKWWNDETETWDVLDYKPTLPPEVPRKYKFRNEE